MASNWRASREYRIWRVAVIRRDVRCMICGSMSGRQAHHKNSASYFIDERFDVDNGVCLCAGCHIDFHTNFKRSFREKCTAYEYDNFAVLSIHLYNRITKNIFKKKNEREK